MKAPRIGLTGGIGSGKSTALQCFAERGWSTLSADPIVGELYAQDTELRHLLAQRYGPEILTDDGIDRPTLASRIFADAEEKRWLEAVVHPRVRQEWLTRSEAPVDIGWIIEIPLLYEKKLETHFSAVVSIWSPWELVLSRLKQRGLDQSDAEARASRQLPPELKASRADFVLANTASLSFLKQQIDRLHPLLTRVVGHPDSPVPTHQP